MDITTDFDSCKHFGMTPEQFALAAGPALSASDPSALTPNERLQRLSPISQADRLGLADPVQAVVVREVAPRYSNTGAQRTETPLSATSALLGGSDAVPDTTPAFVYQGFLIDWLRFVVISVDEQAAMLKTVRSEPDDWSELASGHMGYRRCYRNGGLAIYYDHAEEGRGICFDVSGKGCRQLELPGGLVYRNSWEWLLNRLTTSPGVHLTRLDVAMDDKQGLVDMEQVSACVEEGRVVSRFKTAFRIEKLSLRTGKGFGKTVNFGSRNSDMMIRMYNKAAEQKKEADGHWTRVEIEAKDENAMELAKLMVNAPGGEAGAVVAGVLRNYVTFRDRNDRDTNRRRWPICGWWLSFLEHAERLRIALAKQEPLLIRMRGWVERQVIPTLALLYLHANILEPGSGGKRLLADLVSEGERRLRPKHRDALARDLMRLTVAAPVDGPTGF